MYVMYQISQPQTLKLKKWRGLTSYTLKEKTLNIRHTVLMKTFLKQWAEEGRITWWMTLSGFWNTKKKVYTDGSKTKEENAIPQDVG